MDKDILKNAENEAGWLGIFRTIACVGDSLSSGELVSVDKNGAYEYNDYFEYSWGQYIARKYGNTVYNFSRGGMTAKEYLESFGDRMRFFRPEVAAQAYFFALGENDLFCRNQEPGTTDDFDDSGAAPLRDTFAGWFGTLLMRYKNLQPRAKFFLITMPDRYDDDEFHARLRRAHHKLMHAIANKVEGAYVVDLFEYAPLYDEKFFRRHMMNGHLTPSGYLLSAEFISRLADAIIDEHIEDFREVGFIGTSLVEKR